MNTPRLSADARREQILDVAIDVFGRSGYYGASMNDIAEAAGVTKPVLYQHFDSKSDLYSALLDEVGNRMLDAIAKATADATDGKQQTERGFRPTSAGSPIATTSSCSCSAAAHATTASSAPRSDGSPMTRPRRSHR